MKFIERSKRKKLRIISNIIMGFTSTFNLESKNSEGVVIRLWDLKHLIERLNVRFGLSAKDIGRHLKLHERSVKKLMNMQIPKEFVEI